MCGPKSKKKKRLLAMWSPLFSIALPTLEGTLLGPWLAIASPSTRLSTPQPLPSLSPIAGQDALEQETLWGWREGGRSCLAALSVCGVSATWKAGEVPTEDAP